ncbi:protein kinase domain-containing protein [Sorangium sp. So ce1335]|uniref:protein kinase domain-containing protein n=1 Tax=Sorangium sp. So ce1335 TaxID=3133335 RepID=UPI003F63B13C
MRSGAEGGEAPARATVEVVRCASCGRRKQGACPECARPGRPLSDQPCPPDITEVVPVTLPRFDGYWTRRVLGRGGFGLVFEAEPEGGGAPVAIKLARAHRRDAGQRLRGEIDALSAVGPPHVPAVHAWGTLDDGSPYAVLERVAALTLAARLASRPAPGIDEAAQLGLAVLAALEVVHARGYVHCDLKPENLFVSAAGRATIIDFGIARVVGRRGDAPDEELAVGTAEYMAPEQSAGRADLDARADIYAMGVILYELFAGRPPFWGPRAAVLEDHRSRRPPRLSARVAVPVAVEEVVHRCLAKDRSERFASAAELREALERALGDELTPSQREGPRSVAGTERRAVGLLFFEGAANRMAVQRRIRALGGELAHASGSRYAAVFGHGGATNPARHAQRAADELLRAGLCERVLIDLAPVSVQTRPDGAQRFLSPLFSRPERWPSTSGPLGPFLSPSAAAALPDAPSAVSQDEAARGTGRPPGAEERETTDPGAFVGRRDTLEQLLRSAGEALRLKQPTVVSVISEPGYGKTRLFAELGKQLREHLPHARVIELRGQEPTTGVEDATLHELVRGALDAPDAPPESGVRVALAAWLGPELSEELGSGLAMALGWMDERMDGKTFPELQALRAAPGALRSARVRAAGECLRRRAASSPVVVLLDDAHFAHDATLAALEFGALADGAAPLWICAMGRPAFEAAHPSWGERAARREIVRLGRLDPESAGALCRRLLLPARDVPEPAIERLLERSQGVPLLLVELVHGLKREGILRRHPRGNAWYLATDELDRLPVLPLIDPLAQGEIAALGPALGAHARLVSLLGAEVSLEEIAGVLRHLDERGEGDAYPLDARVGTERLLQAGVLVADRKRLGFRHSLVREAIVRGVDDAERRRIHLAAYEHHRESAEESPELRRFKIAYHAAEAGLADVAEEAYLELAERARARHAYVEAELYYSRALAQPVEERSARRRAARRGRGLMRYRLGRYHDALGDLDRARAMAVEEGDVTEQIEILLDEATALDWMDEYGRSKERVEEAKARVAGDLPPALAARLSMAVARSLLRESRAEEAALQFEAAAAQAEAVGDECYETLVVSLLLLGFIYPGLGRLDDAGAVVDRTIRMCESRGDLLHLGPAINSRALLRACLGDAEGMILDLCRLLTISRELGLGMLELVGEFNLGEYLYLMGHLETAMLHVERAVALERHLRGEESRPVVELLLARLLLYKGDERGAREIIEGIRARQAKVAAEGRGGIEMAPSEEVQWSMIDLATREASDEAWDELEERSARCSMGQEQIEVIEARARACSRRGRHVEARAALERAIEVAGRIPNVMRERLERQRGEQRAGEASTSS